MLKRLSISNFKSWRSLEDMRLAPITGLFGANSSGKTSLLQLLLLLKQTVDCSDRNIVLDFGNEHTPIQLGGFEDVVTGHASKSLGARFGWKPSDKLSKVVTLAKPANLAIADEIDFSFEIHADADGRLSVERRTVYFPSIPSAWFPRFAPWYQSIAFRPSMDERQSNELVAMIRAKDGQITETSLPGPSVEPPNVVLPEGLPSERDKPSPSKEASKFYLFPKDVSKDRLVLARLNDLQSEIESLFRSAFYLGPMRQSPQRHYVWSGSEPEHVGAFGERTIDAMLSAKRRGSYLVAEDGGPVQTLEERVAHWLKRLGLIHQFRVVAIGGQSRLQEVRVRSTELSPEVLITDVGFGVSQLLPVLVLCHYVPEGSILILEQPEIHLHPSVQSGLADLFIEVSKTRKLQIIVESHSEHLLRRLQRRIAEEQLSPDDVALYFCRMENGESKLDALEVDPYGSIANWPRDFFGDEFGEAAAMTKAAARRKKARSEPKAEV